MHGDEAARRFLAAEVDGHDLPGGWLEDKTNKHLHTWTRSRDHGWEMEQTWGFELIGGQRFHTRRVVVQKGGQTERARVVYDYTAA